MPLCLQNALSHTRSLCRLLFKTLSLIHTPYAPSSSKRALSQLCVSLTSAPFSHALPMSLPMRLLCVSYASPMIPPMLLLYSAYVSLCDSSSVPPLIPHSVTRGVRPHGFLLSSPSKPRVSYAQFRPRLLLPFPLLPRPPRSGPRIPTEFRLKMSGKCTEIDRKTARFKARATARPFHRLKPHVG